MDQVIVYERAGEMHVVTPAPGDTPIEKIAAAAVPKGFSFTIIDRSELPRDRAGRARWRLGADRRGRQVKVAAPTVEELRADGLAELARLVAALGDAIGGDAHEAERLSWPNKLIEAEIVTDGGQSDLLEAEAAHTGEPVPALAARIIARAAIHRRAAAELSGIRRAAADAIGAAKSKSAVDAAVAAARAAADAALASFTASLEERNT